MNRLLRCATAKAQVSQVSVNSTYSSTRLTSFWGNHHVASGSRRRTSTISTTATAALWPSSFTQPTTRTRTTTWTSTLFDYSTMSLSVATTNTPTGAASSLVQSRTMAKKSWSGDRYSNNSNNNNTRSGGVPPPKQQNQNQQNQNNNMLRLQMCWTPYDLEQVDYDEEDGGGGNGDDEDDEYLFVKSKFDLRDIKQKAKDMFDSNDDLEYHDGHEWKPLKDINVLSKYRGGKEPVPIRVPEVYDEEGYDDDDGEEDYERDEDDDEFREEDYDDEDDEDFRNEASADNPAATEMKDMIRDLAVVLVESGYTRSSSANTPLTLVDANNNTVSTTAWILQHLQQLKTTTDTASALTSVDAYDDTGALKASSDTDSLSDRLEHVLLGHVGALDHIAQCLDYDFVWEAAKLQKQVEGIVNDRAAVANAQTQNDN